MSEEYKERQKELKKQYQALKMQRMTLDQQIADIISSLLQVIPDEMAVKIPLLYPDFYDLIGQTFKDPGYKFTWDNDLYKTRQPNFTFEKHYPPGVDTESLYEYIDEKHAGTVEDPIPFKGNMELFKGKYYLDLENGIVYYCFNGTGQAVSHKLSELVDLNVQPV